MAYSSSFPLTRWHGPRRSAIGTLATAHAATGEVDGPGRPLEIGRPIAHAYVLRVVAEFQAFTRDLHDLASEMLVGNSEALPQHRPMLIAAATDGRYIDRGNADLRSLSNDFKRIGMSGLRQRIAPHNQYWEKSATRRGDRAYYGDLIELRNCLAHGNQGQLDRLRSRGTSDTVTWARSRLPGLDRTARAFDRAVWDHLMTVFETDPW